jgi:murein tripeptide amidase MpaA
MLPPLEWQTHAERTNYRETPRYAETIEFAQRLAQSSPLIEFQTFGKSGEGRDLPLLIASEDATFSPDAAKATTPQKPIILIQACIHAGEPDGKDAGFALLRDIAITKTVPNLLKNVVVLFIPIYNADGHERSSPYNRINQNGPEEMGWRTTSTYQNLNRDYMKADTPETRAWLALWNRWQPDLFIDCHVTDGADYRYNITYQFEHHDGVDENVLAWEREVINGKVKPATEAAGNLLSWYLEFRDNRDLTLGIEDFNGSPRFSTGYTPLRNRPGVLIETHMLKDYRSRVVGTYDFLRATVEEVNRNPEALLHAVRAADEKTLTSATSGREQWWVPLTFERTTESRRYDLKALEYQTEQSSISGATRVTYGTTALDLDVPMYDSFRVRTAIVPPLYYIVPPQWDEVIQRLKAHGLELQALREPAVLDVESYRFEDVVWPLGPFEGRHMPSYTTSTIRGERLFPSGSVLVPLGQKLAKLAINLLEPLAPDSLVSWGFFNAIFEHKEYAEAYILEDLARKMIAADPGLLQEFESRLASDPEFAASSSERLKFFYMRSPYWDPLRNVYPVGRVLKEPTFKTIDLE